MGVRSCSVVLIIRCGVWAMRSRETGGNRKDGFRVLRFFEDALQYYSAKSCGADVIVTRNKKDFAVSELPICLPAEYLHENH